MIVHTTQIYLALSAKIIEVSIVFWNG